MNSISKEFQDAIKDSHNAQCVGCGYCCRKSPCGVAVRIYGPVRECPALIYDKEQKRYFCKLCQSSDSLGDRYREELSIGVGCCSPLFNQDRKNIPPPKVEMPPPRIGKQLRAFLHAMGGMGPFGPSGDLLWLVVHSAAKELGEGKEWIQACFAAIKEERRKEADEFMGKVEETSVK